LQYKEIPYLTTTGHFSKDFALKDQIITSSGSIILHKDLEEKET
jgi:hypothetical protein